MRISVLMMGALAAGWLSVVQASAATHFHTYVTVSIDGEIVIAPAIASVSGLMADIAVPGGLHAVVTSRETDASSFEVQVHLYEFKGGPIIGSTTFSVHAPEYSASLEFPLKAARQLRLQLRGQRLQLAAQSEGV